MHGQIPLSSSMLTISHSPNSRRPPRTFSDLGGSIQRIAFPSRRAWGVCHEIHLEILDFAPPLCYGDRSVPSIDVTHRIV